MPNFLTKFFWKIYGRFTGKKVCLEETNITRTVKDEVQEACKQLMNFEEERETYWQALTLLRNNLIHANSTLQHLRSNPESLKMGDADWNRTCNFNRVISGTNELIDKLDKKRWAVRSYQ